MKTEKELFEIALRYVEKSYNSEDLRYGDDLYGETREDINTCVEIFHEIKHEGLKWAYEQLKNLSC